MNTQIQASNAAAVAAPRVAQAARPAEAPRDAAATGTAARPEREAPKREELAAAAQKIQHFVEQRTAELQFSVDESSGMQVVRVLDRTTKEVIRQIPSQEALEIAQALEKLQGILLKQKA